MKVYEIREEFKELQELIEQPLEIDQETGEILEDNTELIQQLLSELEATKEQKADSICGLIAENKMYETQLKAEAKRLLERAKMFANTQERLKNLLNFLLSGEKLKTSHFTISYRTSTRVKIVDEAKIPADYIIVEEIFKIDKKAIGAKLKEFETIEGAELEINNNILIK